MEKALSIPVLLLATVTLGTKFPSDIPVTTNVHYYVNKLTKVLSGHSAA